MRKTLTQTFSIEISQSARLDEAAAQVRRSRSALVREAIDLILDRYESKPAQSEREQPEALLSRSTS